MIKFTGEQMNELFPFMNECSYYGETVKITPELIEDSGINELLEPLMGYEFRVESDRDHRTDGQMVDYDFFFTSPEGKVTEVTTERCLMVGWNHWREVEIE